MGKRVMRAVWAAGLMLLLASAAWAQGPAGPATTMQPRNLLDQVITTVVFSVIGIVVAIGGFKLFDVIIPFDLEREICEKNNIAAGILGAAMVLGICLIVGAVVLAP